MPLENEMHVSLSTLTTSSGQHTIRTRYGMKINTTSLDQEQGLCQTQATSHLTRTMQPVSKLRQVSSIKNFAKILTINNLMKHSPFYY